MSALPESGHLRPHRRNKSRSALVNLADDRALPQHGSDSDAFNTASGQKRQNSLSDPRSPDDQPTASLIVSTIIQVQKLKHNRDDDGFSDMMDDGRPLNSNGDHGGDPDVIRYQSKHDSFLLRWTPTRVCKRHANNFVNCLTQTLSNLDICFTANSGYSAR